MCTKLCGHQSLVKKIYNADMKKRIKKMSLRLVFIEMIFKKKLSCTYATQYIHICI